MTLAVHAVDRAQARLDRVVDELQTLRDSTPTVLGLEVDESRLLVELAAAERSLRSCVRMATEMSTTPEVALGSGAQVPQSCAEELRSLG